MASSTASTRPGRSAGSGISKRMPASRILAFTRTRRWLIAAGATRNADAIVVPSRPSTVCSHQRCAGRLVDRRVGADEQELQPLVRKDRLGRSRLLRALGDELEGLGGRGL